MLRFLVLLLLILPVAAYAAEDEEGKLHTYSPDFCEFTISFPSEPYTSRRCENELSKDRCYDLVSYTQVYDLSSTVNFRVICNPVGDDVIKSYSEEVMKATLRAMTKKSVVSEYNTSFREEESGKYKQAGLVGEGLSGRTPTIYIAQLWIGEKSAFSLEAELIGEPDEGPDELFRNVLMSVGHQDDIDVTEDGNVDKGDSEEGETEEEAAQDKAEGDSSDEGADEDAKD